MSLPSFFRCTTDGASNFAKAFQVFGLGIGKDGHLQQDKQETRPTRIGKDGHLQDKQETRQTRRATARQEANFQASDESSSEEECELEDPDICSQQAYANNNLDQVDRDLPTVLRDLLVEIPACPEGDPEVEELESADVEVSLN